MKVKHYAQAFPRRVISSVLVGILLCNAAPLALAQASSTLYNTGTPARGSMLDLYRGEVRMLHVPGTIKRIAVGNGSLITANVVDGRLMLIGEAPGVASLVVWNERGIALQTTVRVAKGDVNFSVEQLRTVLRTVPGLHIDPVGPNIVLSGVVHRNMLPLVKAATEDLTNVIDTTTTDEGDALKKTIHFKVQIMELTRNAQKNLGIAWDSSFAGPTVAGQGFLKAGANPEAAFASTAAGSSLFVAGIASKIASRINLAINDGDAFLLAAPELNTKSGGTATFLAGGQVPIPRAGALGTTDVEFKDYGIKLNIRPVVDANNIISASLDTEISQLDPSVSYGGYPGFLTRRTTSDISLRAGETLAISGLISADALESTTGLPYLSKVPIIGKLFGSESFRAKKSDLVIFVTPVISDPSQAPNTNLLSRADAVDEQYRERYGAPSPLAKAADKNATPEPRQRIAPTQPIPVAPVRSLPYQATQWTQPPAAQQPSPAPVPSSSAGLADAIRMLNTPRDTSAAAKAGAAPAAAPGGKLPAQQVGVLGSSGN
ncbi:pilus assembly protein N-terminal domain-containing protein [Paraburkholderia bonniea]|uniref:type II and III secretion system protein family protein n=1 Tax=Paraburkholderia bonniea TaxID=2152891 RepID=UPI001290E6DE|nr:pilus assembly protein N-terminal domain-containing protein [Paraburkholderia bonniea]WJF91763.1 pilus assembly protein N-terminal domain-containing protein [Paraburkholderia bonniea]WJF95083.1 pilus assembly protein N-terminal domain-containing protein [Paraburkholderia bonniea]